MRALALLLIVIAPAVRPAAASTWLVHPDGSGDFPTIQAAVLGSTLGDTIRLSDGVFSGPGNRSLQIPHPRIFTSVSGDPTACHIDAEGFALGTLGVDPDATEHFIFQGIGFYNGRGLIGHWDKQVHFTRCRFESCAGVVFVAVQDEPAGLIAMDDCDIVDCTPSDVTWGGTLITTYQVDIHDCRFTGNTSPNAYSLQLAYGSRATFDACTFAENANGGINMALVGSSGEDGVVGEALFRDCLFTDNHSGYCALAYSEPARFERCRFESNSGHGIDLYTEYDHDPQLVEVVDCTFFGNGGAGIVRYDIGLDLEGCSFVNGGGPADIAAWSSPAHPPLAIDRCLFAFRPFGQVLWEESGSAALAVTCTDIYGIYGVEWAGVLAPFYGIDGNFAADPRCCDAPAGDLTLFNTSPCLPANNTCGVLIGAEGQGCTDPTAAPPVFPTALRLVAQPNPFNPTVQLSFSLPLPLRVNLAVFDASGRRVATLLGDALRPAGDQSADWNATGLPSGIYLARLEAAGLHEECKLTLLR